MSKMEKKLKTLIDAFQDERVRWMIGQSRNLLSSEVIEEEKLDEIIHGLIRNEIEIHSVLRELEKDSPSSKKELAEATDLPEERVQEHLRVLTFLNEVSEVECDREVPCYELSPIMEEERRRCPCEALVRELLEKADK